MRRQTLFSTVHTYSLLMNLKNFVCNIGEDAELLMSLYDPDQSEFIRFDPLFSLYFTVNYQTEVICHFGFVKFCPIILVQITVGFVESVCWSKTCQTFFNPSSRIFSFNCMTKDETLTEQHKGVGLPPTKDCVQSRSGHVHWEAAEPGSGSGVLSSEPPPPLGGPKLLC